MADETAPVPQPEAETPVPAAAPEAPVFKHDKQPDLPPEAMKDALGRYPSEFINEDTLKPATIGECEAILSAMNMMSGTLRAKAHLVHAALEAKQTERDAIRKSGGFTDADKEAMKAHWAKEDAIKNSDMTAEEKSAALSALNHIEEVPPAQHLQGSHITKDNDQVNPGGQ